VNKFWFLIQLSFCVAFSLTIAEAEENSGVILTIGKIPVTKRDLAAAYAGGAIPKKSFEIKSAHEAQLNTLRSIILQRIAEKFTSPKELQNDPILTYRLEDARRSILLDHYIQKSLGDIPPASDGQIKNYITDHPEEFQGRMTFHYGSLIIEPKSAVKAALLDGRLKAMNERDEIRPDDIKALVYWLAENQMEYGYAAMWKQTESLPPKERELILSLLQQKKKINIEKNSAGMYRLYAIFDAMPDPIDPLSAKMMVKQRLLEQEKARRVYVIAQDMLSRADVVIFDKEFADLDLPAQVAPSASATSPSLEPKVSFPARMVLAANVVALLLTPFALRFFSSSQPAEEDMPLPPVPALTYTWQFRALICIIFSGLIAFFVWETLMSASVDYEKSAFFTTVIVAALGAALLLTLSLKVRKLRQFILSNRWTPISMIFTTLICVIILSDLLA
jgi:hypothetical protein